MVLRKSLWLIGLLVGVLWAQSVVAEPVLELRFGQSTERLTRSALLARADVIKLRLSRDVAYRRVMTYQAVPLLALLSKQATQQFDILEAAATDGYVSQLPMSLIERGAKGGAIAWLAIEEADQPWPNVPKKTYSAGPFYIVWQDPDKSGVQAGHWPYALGSLTGVRLPELRWPQMAVADPARHPAARRGMKVFVAKCFTCHRMKGAGLATMGPDLGHPMNVTDYFTERGLRALIRAPKSVRTWPAQTMTGLDKTALPDQQLDDLIAYLTYLARP